MPDLENYLKDYLAYRETGVKSGVYPMLVERYKSMTPDEWLEFDKNFPYRIVFCGLGRGTAVNWELGEKGELKHIGSRWIGN